MVIDSHVHFWEYDPEKHNWITDDMKILQQHHMPEHLSALLNKNGVDAVVAVQALQTEGETIFLRKLAAAYPVIKGVVGWVDFTQANIEQRLRYFSQIPIIKGWRHIVQAEPEGFLLTKDFRNGIGLLSSLGYTYDILVYHHQLKEVAAFINKFPQQYFVIDHCGKPAIKNNDIAEWSRWIREIAGNPRVYCKLSGLLTEADTKQWAPEDFYPCLDVVFECFGTDRLMFGSDWPVMLLRSGYVQWKSLLERYMRHLGDDEKKKVFGKNAVNFYQL